jgi:hypothetical protein
VRCRTFTSFIDRVEVANACRPKSGFAGRRCATVVPDTANALDPAFDGVPPNDDLKAVPTVDVAPHLSRRAGLAMPRNTAPRGSYARESGVLRVREAGTKHAYPRRADLCAVYSTPRA